MSNKVSFIIQLKNQFGGVAEKVKRQFAGITKGANKSGGAMNRFARNTKAALLKARRSLRKYRKETVKSEKATGNFTKKLKGFIATAVAGFGLAALIREGAAFQDAILDLQAITGAAGKDLTFLKETVRELSVEFGALPTDVAKMTKLIASAKPELLKNTKALADMTAQTLLLKNAAGIEAVEAVDTLARGLNIFGKGADSATQFVDILAAGAKFGSSEIGNTGQAMLIAGGAAVDAGLNFRELNAAIQVAAKGGFVGAQSGTALQQIFIRLTKQGFDFKKLGVDGVMLKVAAALDKVKGSAEKAKLKSKLFGEEHQKVAGALLREIPLITELNEKLKQQGVAAEQARIKMSGFNFQVAQGAAKISVLASRIFDSAQPALTGLAATANSFIGSLDPSDVETFGIALSAVARIAQALAKVISIAFNIVLGVLKPVFAILKGIGTLLGQIVGAFATLDFSQFNLSDAFSLGGKALGLFGGESPAPSALAAASAPRLAPSALAAASAPRLAPSAPVSAANGTINGQITVAAAPGSTVRDTSMASRGSGLNLGVNMVAQ